jgi:hypothetical protein
MGKLLVKTEVKTRATERRQRASSSAFEEFRKKGSTNYFDTSSLEMAEMEKEKLQFRFNQNFNECGVNKG